MTESEARADPAKNEPIYIEDEKEFSGLLTEED